MSLKKKLEVRLINVLCVCVRARVYVLVLVTGHGDGQTRRTNNMLYQY